MVIFAINNLIYNSVQPKPRFLSSLGFHLPAGRHSLNGGGGDLTGVIKTSLALASPPPPPPGINASFQTSDERSTKCQHVKEV